VHVLRQPWGDVLVELGEPRVCHVHLREAAVRVVIAVVEPPADVLAVRLGEIHGCGTVRRGAGAQRVGEGAQALVRLGFELDPVLLGVLRRTLL